MEACAITIGILLTVVVVAVLVLILRPSEGSSNTKRPPPERAPRSRWESCPSCDAPLFPNDRDCPSCRIDLYSRLAGRLDRVRIARREVRNLLDDGLIDAETADRVAEQLNVRKKHLLRPPEREPQPAGPPPVPRPEAPRPKPPPLPTQRPAVEEFPPVPPEPAAPRPTAEAPEPVTPSRSLAEVLGQFMHERNILWGELAGGLLIVGCSIALVLSLWRTLEELPYFTFLLFAAITSAVFGAGQYTLHHWKLTATSRGLLVIGLLLTPLNLLLLADPGAKGITDLLDAAVKVAAVIGFSLLVRTGARDLVGTDVLPGPISRRWLLALAVVGAPASQMIPPLFGIEPAIVRTWLPLACYAIACGATIRRLSREQRTATEALGERPAAAVLCLSG